MRIATVTLLAATMLSGTAPAFAQQPMEIADLFMVRSVGQVAVSPDGQTVAYTLSRMRDVTAGEKNGTSLSEVRLMTADGEDSVFIPESAKASSIGFLDDDTLLYRAAQDGKRVLMRKPLSGGEAQQMFAHSSSISRYALSADGSTLLFTASNQRSDDDKALRKKGFDANVIDEDVRFTRLYRVDLTAEEPSAAVVKVEGQVSTIAASPDGSLVAVSLAETPLVGDDIINKTIHVLDTETGDILRTAETEGKVGNFAFSPDGERLGFLAGTSRHDASAHTVAVMDLIEGTTRFLTGEDDADEVDFVWTGNSTMRVLVQEGTGSAQYTLSADGEVSDRTDNEGFVVTSIAGDEDGIAAVGQSPGYPSALFKADAEGAFSKVTAHNEEWLADVTLYPQRVVRYAAKDGTEIEGILIEPDDAPKDGAPTIAVVHGGPEAHYSNGWLTSYSTPGQIGAGDGFAVFYPNYRGSTGRGQAFASLDHDNPPAAEFDDIVDGIDYLANEGITDPDRVGITGGSYGGYASAWGATKLTERFRAAVVFVALTDLRSFMATTDIPDEMVDSHFRETPEENPEAYVQQSPITHAAQSTTPTLILHGEADPRVHPSQSLQLYRTMQRLSDAQVRLVTYPGEGHGNRKAAAQFDYAHRMLRWFDTYLNGERFDEKPPMVVPAVRALVESEADGSSD